MKSNQNPDIYDNGDEKCIVCNIRPGGGRSFAYLTYEGRLVPLCCPLCLEIFQRNPVRYTGKREAKKLYIHDDETMRYPEYRQIEPRTGS